MVSVVGANFPRVPYLTSSNIASPLVKVVFSDFTSVGINLPLTPGAFMGSGSATPDVIIVVQE
jgi:hypothetical protein